MSLPWKIVAATALSSMGCFAQQSPPPVASATSTSAPLPAPPPPPPRAKADEPRHVYRFDLVLTPRDATSAVAPSTFAITVEEGRSGEVMVGKNVALVAAPVSSSSSSPAPAHVAPRQDVGIKLVLFYRTSGDDLLLDVRTEMSAHEPPSTIRKVTTTGNALASAGKSTLIVALDEDKKHYDLSVTPTKLR